LNAYKPTASNECVFKWPETQSGRGLTYKLCYEVQYIKSPAREGTGWMWKELTDGQSGGNPRTQDGNSLHMDEQKLCFEEKVIKQLSKKF